MLSKLSQQLLEDYIKFEDNIPESLAHDIVKSYQNLLQKFSSNKVLKETGLQTLFFLPTLIKSINLHNYTPLVETIVMVGGDITSNVVLNKVINHIQVVKTLSNPIMKIYTIYSIIELHKELNQMPDDDPRKEKFKISLMLQYENAGLLIMDILGIETMPLWIISFAVQLIFETYEFKKEYNLDISYLDAFLMELGFEQDRLTRIFDERSLVQEYLSYNKYLGWQIVQIPKIDKDVWEYIDEQHIPIKILNQINKKIAAHKACNDLDIREDIYKLTVKFYTKTKASIWGPAFNVNKKCYTTGIKSKEWAIKKLYISPQNSDIGFSEFTNQKIVRLESNNWFLDHFKQQKEEWCRVPQLDKGSDVCPFTTNKSPILQNTGFTAVYINKNSHQLNNIFLHYNPVFGSVHMKIKANGLKTMDYINKVHLIEIDSNISYNNSMPYTFHILVLAKQYKVFYPLHKNNAELSVMSDNDRVITSYTIDNHSPCAIYDVNSYTKINFIFDHNLNNTDYYYTYGIARHITINKINDQESYTESNIYLLSDKKYLSITYNHHIISQKQIFGAKHLEVFNVQGLNANSTLEIENNTQTFNITVFGNITITHKESAFVIDVQSPSVDAIGIHKSEIANGGIIYNITVNNMDDVLRNIVRYKEEDSSQIDLEFSILNKKCLFKNIVSKNIIITFNGKLETFNVILVMDINEKILNIVNSETTTSIITHYNDNNINIEGYLLGIFTYKREIGNKKIIGNSDYLSNTDNYSFVYEDGIFYEFIKCNNTRILHHFPNYNQDIVINNIQYAINNGQIWALDNISDLVNIKDLLYVNFGEGMTQLGISFPMNIEEVTLTYHNNSLVIMNGLNLKEILPDTKLKFNNLELTFNIINKTIIHDTDLEQENTTLLGDLYTIY
ncbi:hypothetical protein NOVO_06710 [Rickettsiales bacterium Ac37b]|nr:hypothetical protein NOVO_06710 [Rickettsiales bacterium Ac37b]